MKKIKDFLMNIVIFFYKLFCRIFTFKPNWIVFESSLFRNYTGNPRYIYEKMVELGLDQKYKLFWIFKDLDDARLDLIPGEFTPIKYKTFKFFKVFASASFIVSDSRLPKYLYKKKKCTYIQTWHGTPLKKLALDMKAIDMGGSNDIKTYHKNFKKSSSLWDLFISQNPFSSETFHRCFAYDGPMLEIGYPRNDKLVETTPSQIYELKRKMQLPLNKKIILYAPTWRDNQFYKQGEYKFASAMDFDLLREKLSDDYVMIVKYHYLIKDSVDWSKYEGFVYQYGEECDIADLYLVSDMLITDYSSVMFDYSVLRRPMIFFAYDIDEYMNDLRGFYFDFRAEAPGPIVENNDDLVDAILNYSADEWSEKAQAFYHKYNPWDTGEASAKVVELIEEKLK